MPFINVKVAGAKLERQQVKEIQEGITRLMADVLGKVGPLVAVLVEQTAAEAWSIGGAPVTRAAQVDAIVSAGTNSPQEKARFVAEAFALMRAVLGPDLAEVSYVVVHEVERDSWGYGGRTQLDRAGPRT